MSLGYRVFFVHDGEVQRIAQKRFNSLYRIKPEALPKYANLTVVSVLVVYELVARKPDRIVRMDTQKIRFDENGFVDEAYELEGLQLVTSKIDDAFANLENGMDIEKPIIEDNAQGSVVDANKHFDKRRWNQRHPELSGVIHKKIMIEIFGSST